ncbi:fatty acyl-AMP ligase [Burkholderia thailandensis]|uniref:fatty acyl-AMP ligase n=1 Tax=Burkholderia thailandensis TaxID=57975 RepID=UPI000755F5B9|nr:fatty acyl-AMP ligase [Burkholderia thailandensis]KVG16363.1 AMP-binding protein [Burkholderia thailandensis]MCS6478303.1 fatty acyl-AMP ligase [Burkholderia thailandensis]
MSSIQSALAACRSLTAPPPLAPAANFADVLRFRADTTPDEFAYGYLGFGRTPDRVMRYGDIHRRALAIAREIAAHGRPGDPVLLIFPSAADFIEAFFGCLYAGRMAVPALPPRTEKERRRLISIARDCAPSLAICGDGEMDTVLAELCAAGVVAPPCREVGAIPDCGGGNGGGPSELPAVAPDSIAFLQYTSGSTSDPKGVMVGHDNLLANERLLRRHWGSDRERWLIVSWLPHYHDMGLIGGILQPIYAGRPAVFMSPQDFLQHPARWLHAVSDYGATCSGAPNFGYELCRRRASRMDLTRLDLSTWEQAFNGAEPVRPRTMREFADAFSSTGFRHDAFAPCYGLAELTLVATSKQIGAPVVIRRADCAALADGRFEPPQGDGRSIDAVSVGALEHAHQAFCIVDPSTGEPQPTGAIGEICIASDSVCHGYFGRPDATDATFRAYRSSAFPNGMLRTGDLGFIDDDGHLFVSGRIKDLIILNGVNYYPQDIEGAVLNVSDQIRANRLAAIAVERGEQAGVVVVLEAIGRFDLAALAPEISREVWDACQLTLSGVIRVKKGEIHTTSSGKIQRATCAKMLADGAFTIEDAYLHDAAQAWLAPLVERCGSARRESSGQARAVA